MDGRGADSARQIIDWKKITQDDLCLDSTVLTRYGVQEGAKRGYNPAKKGRPSHHPLLAYLGCGLGVNLWNRSGNTASNTNAIAFLDRTLRLLDGITVTFLLCDSGFYSLRFLRHLEGKGMTALVFHNLIHYLKATVIVPQGPLPQLKTLRGKYFIIPGGALGNSGGRRAAKSSWRSSVPSSRAFS